MADGNKTEQATPKRRKKAREQGQVALSRELPGVFALAAVAGVTTLMAPTAVNHWTTLYRDTLYVAASSNIDRNGPVLFWSAVEVMRWIIPILLAAMTLSVFAGLMQSGINIAPEALALKFARFNTVSEPGPIFSPVGLSKQLQALLPFARLLRA